MDISRCTHRTRQRQENAASDWLAKEKWGFENYFLTGTIAFLWPLPTFLLLPVHVFKTSLKFRRSKNNKFLTFLWFYFSFSEKSYLLDIASLSLEIRFEIFFSISAILLKYQELLRLKSLQTHWNFQRNFLTTSMISSKTDQSERSLTKQHQETQATKQNFKPKALSSVKVVDLVQK